MTKNVVLRVVMRNEETALLRILRIINRQGFCLNKLKMQLIDDNKALELYISLECVEEPLQLVKLVKKQVPVVDVKLQDGCIPLAG